MGSLFYSAIVYCFKRRKSGGSDINLSDMGYFFTMFLYRS